MTALVVRAEHLRALVTIDASELGAHKVPHDVRVDLLRMGLAFVVPVGNKGVASMALTRAGRDALNRFLGREVADALVLAEGA